VGVDARVPTASMPAPPAAATAFAIPLSGDLLSRAHGRQRTAFWMWSQPGDWHLDAGCEWTRPTARLRLASRRGPTRTSPRMCGVEGLVGAGARARGARRWPRPTLVDSAGAAPCGAGRCGRRRHLLPLPTAGAERHRAGRDGVLYIALNGSDPGRCARRFTPLQVAAPDFQPWRLAADPDAGCWVLAAGGARRARLPDASCRTAPSPLCTFPSVPSPTPRSAAPVVLGEVPLATFRCAGVSGGRVAVLLPGAGDGRGLAAALRCHHRLPCGATLEAVAIPSASPGSSAAPSRSKSRCWSGPGGSLV